jgi:hypothetical protein
MEQQQQQLLLLVLLTPFQLAQPLEPLHTQVVKALA